jgi:hypothetical protein
MLGRLCQEAPEAEIRIEQPATPDVFRRVLAAQPENA